MNEKQNKKLIPELRFPEFQNDGEWVEKKLGECVFEKNIKTTKNNQYPILTSSKNGIILQNEYFNKQTASTNNIGYKIVDFEDFTYRSMSDTGNFTFNIQYLIPKGIVSPAYPVFQVIKKKIVSNFLYYYLNYSYSIKKQIYKLKQGGTRFALHFKKLSLFQILLPTLPEQQKIADFLSNLDELIDAHKQKLELLKQHKKGLMQKLFPQEGKKLPEWRFPGFKNDGEWVEKELKELGHLIRGLTYSPNDVRDKGLLVLRSSNIRDGVIDLDDCVYVRMDIKGANIIKTNDILICVRNGSKKLIGKNAIIPKGLPLATHGAFMTIFRVAQNPKFIFQLFQTDLYNKQVKADLGATINSINGKNLLRYKFTIPQNQQEQQKIAAFLSNLDELITAEAEKIEQLEGHKKGLMQKMFPEIN